MEHILKIQKENETHALFSSDEDTKISTTEDEIVENYFANMKLRETTWKEWEQMEARVKKLEEEISEWKEVMEEYVEEEEANPDGLRGYLYAKTDEIVDLTDEVSELEARLEDVNHIAEEWEDQAKEKEMENEKLKKENDMLILAIKKSNEQLKEENEKLKEENEKKTNTKNVKGNRKIVATDYDVGTAVFKIPDGLDLEDKSVVEDWWVKWCRLHIQYVGKEEVEEIDWEYEPEVDWKRGHDEIIDADEWGVEYSDDEEEEEEKEKRPVVVRGNGTLVVYRPFWEKPIKRDERGNAIFE